MFARYVFEKSSAEYSDKIILIDSDCLQNKIDYCAYFTQQGYEVIQYHDDLTFRVEHNDAIYGSKGKYALLVKPNSYIPYDVLQRFRSFEVSISNLFPKLNASAIKETLLMNFDLLTMAYNNNFSDLKIYTLTQQFVLNKVYCQPNIAEYLKVLKTKLDEEISNVRSYQDWFRIANLKAEIDVMSIKYNVFINTANVNIPFLDFVLSDFGKLSSVIDRSGPVIVTRVMEFISEASKKFTIVVMDGMSEFDWQIIASSFSGINYEKVDAFAMIPTTTSISRQCLLSNKYPVQLMEPWKQSKEKNEFYDCARNLGFKDMQIGYERGYDAEFAATVKCAAVIINDVDDLVHGQKQSRIGMFNDITVLTKQQKLVELVKRLLYKGFDVYITSDHGNTSCVGMGKLLKTGVEVETKSRRMIVLRDFADKQSLIEQHKLIEYPKYYLSKEYDYLICGVDHSFDAKGEEVMSHGGISIDEVIIPFIKVKADDNNG